MNENKLLETCFTLAENLMWEKNTAPIEKLPEDIAELSEMTSKFIQIANDYYFQVEDLPDSEEIIIGAINYLNLQAIPPLRGNYAWFSNSLSTLLEICHPNCIVGKKELPFLHILQKGIVKHLEWAIKRNDADEFM